MESSRARSQTEGGRRRSTSLSNHYIICGYGRVGRRVADGVPRRRRAVRRARLQRRRDRERSARHGDLFIEGNGTDDEDLEAAGRRRARGLVASSDSDVGQPVHHALGADRRGPSCLIVARASDEDAAEKLRRAGADRVVQPYSTAGQGDGRTSSLKPQVTAFLDAVTDAGGDDFQLEEIEVVDRAERPGGPNDSRPARARTRPGRSSSRCASRTGPSTRLPIPDELIDSGDVMIAVGTPDELRRARGPLRAARGPLRAKAARAARVASSRVAGSSRARAPATGARRLRDERRAPARAGAEAAAAGARRGARRAGRRRSTLSSAPRSPARASSTSGSSPARGTATRCAEIVDAGKTTAAGFARPSRSGCRSRWCRRTRPGRSRSRRPETAPTATRSRALLEFAGHTVEREYYYNDAGAQMDRFRASVEAVAARGGAARGRLPRRVRRRAGAGRGRSGAADARADRGVARALPDPLRLVDAAERARRAAARAHRRGSTRTRRTGRSGSARRSTATTDDRVIIRSPEQGGDADVPRGRHRLPRRQARARLRPRDLRPRRRPSRHARGGTRRSRACSATTPSASRCSCTSSSI